MELTKNPFQTKIREKIIPNFFPGIRNSGKFFFRTGKFEESSKAASTTQQPRKDGRSKKKSHELLTGA